MNLPRGAARLPRRFRLGRLIGRGGMGGVWSALDLQTGHEVAVKFPADASLQEHRRFAAEAEFTMGFGHPNIVRGVERGADPQPYLAMEKIQGHTLGHIRYFRGAMSPEEVLRVGAQTARALEAVHRSGLMHRDVQPENIVVTSQGVVKLIDFGVATHVDPDKPAAMRDDLVTRGYAAPERLPGRRGGPQRGTPASDLFSLGVLLHEMATGRLLFAREDGSSDRSDPPTPLAAAVPEAPRELGDLVAELLRQDPADRPTSAGHVAQLLEDAADRLEPASTPPTSRGLDTAREMSRLAESEEMDRVTVALTGLGPVTDVFSTAAPDPRFPEHGEPTQSLHAEPSPERELDTDKGL